jgi:ABC-type dipeptide/oligopeptide/nickel transport system ATPase component
VAGSYPHAMHISVEMITDAAMALLSDARALLADRLTESLDPLNDNEIRSLWASEALKRLEEVRLGKIQTISADQVLMRVRALVK